MKTTHKLLVSLAVLMALASPSAAQTALGKYGRLQESAAHTVPPAGFQNIWIKASDHLLYLTNSSGTDTAAGGGGGVTVDSPLAGAGTSGSHLTCATCLTASPTTTGDTFYSTSGGVALSRLAIGSANKVLQSSGTVPQWASTLAGLTLTAPVINGATSASGNFDLSGSSGTFLTPTGAGTFGTSSNAFSGSITQTTAVATAQTEAVVVQNTTAATLGAQKFSPLLTLLGHGNGSTTIDADQVVKWGLQVRPVQKATNPTSELLLWRSVNAGSYAEQLEISDSLSNSTITTANCITGGLANSAGFCSDVSSGSSGRLSFWTKGAVSVRADNFPMMTMGIVGAVGSATYSLTGGSLDLTQLGTAAAPFYTTFSRFYSGKLGTAIDSTGVNITVAPNAGMVHVTNAGSIQTITIPYTGFVGCVRFIPDGAFVTTTGGNIALGSTGVVQKMLEECYDGTSWYPSY